MIKLLSAVLVLCFVNVATAKDEGRLIHAWCVPKTPQWPACAKAGHLWCPPGQKTTRVAGVEIKCHE